MIANTLHDVRGPLWVNGNSSTVLNVNDQGSISSHNYTIRATEVSRFNTAAIPDMAPITYAGINTLTVNASTGTDVLSVASTAAGTSTIINGGTGYNTFVFYGDDGTLNNINGPTAIHGGGYPNDFVSFNDSVNTVGQTYTLTADRMSRTGMADVVFDGLNQVILYTGVTAADTVNVESVAPGVFTPIALGNGDKITLGMPLRVPEGGRTLQGIRGAVRPQSYGNGPVSVVVDNSGDTSPRQATFSYDPTIPGFGHVLEGLAPVPIYFQLDADSSMLVKGGSGDDSFRLPTVRPTVPLTLDGSGGTNTLDYSAFTTDVLVNLQTGTATAASAGVVNFADVLGGAGNDILIGNDLDNILTGNGGNDRLLGLGGRDTLYGSSGSDILIGGLGADRIERGTGDDVLIGGYTDYDTQVDITGIVSHNINRAALDAIMGEWTRTDLNSLGALESYKARVDHLWSGVGGRNGSTVLKSNGKNATVHADAEIDRLFGGDGFDWFFATRKEDTLIDPLNQEKVN